MEIWNSNNKKTREILKEVTSQISEKAAIRKEAKWWVLTYTLSNSEIFSKHTVVAPVLSTGDRCKLWKDSKFNDICKVNKGKTKAGD